MPLNTLASVLLDLNGVEQPHHYQLWEENTPMPTGDVLLTLAQLEQWPQVVGKKALLLNPDDTIEQLALPLDALDAIFVYFPSFVDGRGYSFAVLLRRQGFKGTLCAVGDVFKDVVFYLKRCGFDGFMPKADKDASVVAQGLKDFSAGYQHALATETQANYQQGQ